VLAEHDVFSSFVKFGVVTAPQNVTWEEIRATWIEAEQLALDSAWLYDHLLPLSASLEDPIFESWTMLSALAVLTGRIRIGVLVTANTFRHPALLAKMAATVDILSRGRLILGLGAGYYAREHEAYGLHFPARRQRAEMLDETCQILRGLWRGGTFSFAGDYYTITEAPCAPLPAQRPGPPILIGGAGEKYTLKTVARYAQQWNMPGGTRGVTRERFAAKHVSLKKWCADEGRDVDEIETNLALIVLVNEQNGDALARSRRLAAAFGWDRTQEAGHILAGAPQNITRELKSFEQAGVDHFVMVLLGGLNYTDLELFATKVVPHFR
jgi:F420-dependent oxidoreductase-like protein